MKKNILKFLAIILLLLAFCSIRAFAETDAQVAAKMGFKAFQIKDNNGNAIDFYISSYNMDFTKKKPLFIYLQGSGPRSFFYKSKTKNAYCSTLGIIAPEAVGGPKEMNDYYFIIIGKPGIPFFTTEENFNAMVTENYNPPEVYDRLISLSYRANSVNSVIEYCLKQNWADSSKLVVVGHSEGSDVAAKTAVINKRVTHLGFFGGGGPSQMFDFVMYVRKDVLKGKITPGEGEKQIVDLYEQYKKIFADPSATDKDWWGHTYLRWSSFFSEPAVENLLKLNIPIFVGMGTLDESTPIESADIIPVEFTRHGKKNLTYKTYLNCDHGFCEHTKDKNGKEKIIPHNDEVTKDFLDWIKKN